MTSLMAFFFPPGQPSGGRRRLVVERRRVLAVAVPCDKHTCYGSQHRRCRRRRHRCQRYLSCRRLNGPSLPVLLRRHPTPIASLSASSSSSSSTTSSFSPAYSSSASSATSFTSSSSIGSSCCRRSGVRGSTSVPDDVANIGLKARLALGATRVPPVRRRRSPQGRIHQVPVM